MPIGQMSKIFQQLPKLKLEEDVPDAQLLLCFVDRRESTALEILVRRYAPMVWGVCSRILSNHHDIEDAFQATFLVLVRKASSIVPREMVGNWLYGVARQTALKARTTGAIRMKRECQVTTMPETSMRERVIWWDVQPMLDQELSQLPDKYRMAILLCDLEGKTRKEAARQIGCPEGTIATWLARGRLLLAKRLARHGLAVSDSSLATALSRHARVYVPALVVSSTIRAARLFAADQTIAATMVSIRVAALTEGVPQAMLLSNLKVVTVLLLVMGIVAGLGIAIQAQANSSRTTTTQGERKKEVAQLPLPELVPVSVIHQGPPAKEKLKTPVAISLDNVERLRQVGVLERDACQIEWIPGTNELAIMQHLGDEIEVFDASELKSTRKLAKLAAPKELTHFAFSRDGKHLAWSENSESFTIENVKTGKQLSFEADERQPGLAFSPDGKWLAAGAWSRIGLWEVATGEKIRDFETDTGEQGGLTPVFSPDGKILAVGNRNSNPRLFEAATGNLLHVLDKKQTQGIRFNPAGTILATANVDGSVSLWDVATGKLLKEEQTAGEELYRVEWSPKGDLLVTSGRNAKIIVWDAKELKPLRELETPEWVICVRFSPDGSRLLTCGGTILKSPDRKITIWGLEDPKP
jgi:RNA polymerase sigma factor (sigma-70 family)